MQSRQIRYSGILYEEQHGAKLAPVACKIRIGVKLSQQCVSVAGVCVMMQMGKTVFIVVN